MDRFSFKERSQKKELIDSLTDGIYSEKNAIYLEQLFPNLNEFKKINILLGTKKSLLQALKKVYQKNKLEMKTKKITLVDVGCGGGDLLNGMANWFKQKEIVCELLGIDIHPEIVKYAENQISQAGLDKTVSLRTLNVFSEDFKLLQPDIVCMNNVCHHLSNSEIIELFSQLKKQTRIAIILNDLHRHPIAYYAIKWITKIFRLSKLAQHDGPLSVLKSFTKNELIQFFKESKIDQYKISWKWPFRWQVIIWRNKC